MRKLILMCSALTFIAASANAATRLAHVTHIQNNGYQCEDTSNFLSSMIVGAALGKIITGNDRGAVVGAALTSSLNNNNRRCYKVRTVFWQAQSYGRLYRGSTIVRGDQYFGSTIYVDGLP